MDAYLAAFAKFYEVLVLTLDADFQNFEGLDVRML